MKYRRVNMDFTNFLPKLDEADRMDFLQKRTKEEIFRNPEPYNSIADTLIASLFYFEMSEEIAVVDEVSSCSWECVGK